MNANDERVVAEIASRVRAARARRGWTLDELAARSSLSRRLLVQIEHADANPSLTTLLKLAGALQLTLTEIVAERPQDDQFAVVPGRDAMTLWSTSDGSVARLLVSHGPIELWAWTLSPGNRRASQAHRPGSIELITVDAGTVTLDVGDHHVVVPAGDSAWFDATSPHAYSNPGTSTTNFTLVVLEPA